MNSISKSYDANIKNDKIDVASISSMARTRKGRGVRWVHRFFKLSGVRLSYTLKPDAPAIRAAYDLSPGCIVTEIQEEKQLTGKKIYTFWIIWPDDKHNVKESATTTSDEIDDGASDDGECKEAEMQQGLKAVVLHEKESQMRIRDKVAQQVERHVAHDQNVNMSMKMAAAAFGGVLIGALTAGVGLLPYIAVVGVTAIAGGSAAVMRYRTPADSRLIMGLDTIAEAELWKIRVEAAIAEIERSVKPSIPKQIDPAVVSRLLRVSKHEGSEWRRVDVYSSVRILQLRPAELALTSHPDSSFNHTSNTVLRRAQIVLPQAPVAVFLHLMDNPCWPPSSSDSTILPPGSLSDRVKIKILSQLDDHADIIQVQLSTWCETPWSKLQPALFPKQRVDRTLILTRFWMRDDDGIYLITYNTYSPPPENKTATQGERTSPSAATAGAVSIPSCALLQPSFHAVVTVCPRKGVSELDSDESTKELSLITATVQIEETDQKNVAAKGMKAGARGGSVHWLKGEAEAASIDFLICCLVRLREGMEDNRFGVGGASKSAEAASTVHSDGIETYLGPYKPPSVALRPSSPHPTPAPPVVPKKPAHAGIMTVQPGLEGSIGMHPAPAPSSAGPVRRLPPPIRPASFPPNSTTAHSADGEISNGADRVAPSSPLSSSPSTQTASFTTPVPRRKRVTTNQVHQLKGQIAVKEYELQRLTRRSIATAGSASPRSSISSRTSIEDNEQVAQLRLQLHLLMKQYQNLAGEPYEQARRASAVSTHHSRATSFTPHKSDPANGRHLRKDEDGTDGVEMSVIGGAHCAGSAASRLVNASGTAAESRSFRTESRRQALPSHWRLPTVVPGGRLPQRPLGTACWIALIVVLVIISAYLRSVNHYSGAMCVV